MTLHPRSQFHTMAQYGTIRNTVPATLGLDQNVSDHVSVETELWRLGIDGNSHLGALVSSIHSSESSYPDCLSPVAQPFSFTHFSFERMAEEAREPALGEPRGPPDETSPLLSSGNRRDSYSSSESSLTSSSDSSDDDFVPWYFDSFTELADTLPADIEGAAEAPAETGDDVKGGQAEASSTVFRIILILIIGTFTANADGSLVLATHPTIASEFNALSASSWLFVSFTLAGAATQTMVCAENV